MKIEMSLKINASIDRVFYYLDDDERIKMWMQNLIETKYTNDVDKEKPVGTRFKQKLKEGNKIKEYTGEVTGYEKPYYISVRLWVNNVTIQVDYRLKQEGESTVLNYSSEMVRANFFIKLISKCFSGVYKKMLVNDFNKLKELAEGK